MEKGRPAAVRWWNGYSARLDLTHPNGRAWFKEQLDGLVRDFGAGHYVRTVHIDALGVLNAQLSILDAKNLSAFHNNTAAVQPTLGGQDAAANNLFVPFH